MDAINDLQTPFWEQLIMFIITLFCKNAFLKKKRKRKSFNLFVIVENLQSLKLKPCASTLP